MKKVCNHIRWALLVTVMLTSGTLRAVTVQPDTLSIRFRLDSIRIDMGFADNARAWQSFEAGFLEHFAGCSPNSLRLDIYSGASPEGSASHNRWLGENRGHAIRRLVRQRLPGRIGSVIVHNEAARWDGLYEAVARSSEPWRDEALRIVEMPASANENAWDHREYKLRALRGGAAWPVLLEKYLSPLRSGATAVISLVPSAGGRDTVVVRDTVVMVQPVYVSPAPPTSAIDSAVSRAVSRKPALRWPVWILRTNIPLLGFGGTPNLQAEWSLGHKDRWSLNVEGVWSWWTFAFNAYANEIIYGSAELRYWLGRRYRHHTLDGWHIGLGVGGGYGDLEWRSKGYQAEVYSGFLNIGWQRRFGRRKQWAFDMGLGLGYAYVPWRRYDGSTLFPVGREEEHDDHLMWQETSRTNWFTATHANISIGYVFPQRHARWRREKALERDAGRNAYLHFRDSLKARERYVDDSTKTARQQRLEEIALMPRQQRKAALAEFAAEKQQAKADAKAAKKQAKADGRRQRVQDRLDKRRRRLLLREEKASLRKEERDIRRWAKTPEGRSAVRQEKVNERAAEKQARKDRKAARKQARLDKKVERVRSRKAMEHRRNLERFKHDIERADEKYRVKYE